MSIIDIVFVFFLAIYPHVQKILPKSTVAEIFKFFRNFFYQNKYFFYIEENPTFVIRRKFWLWGIKKTENVNYVFVLANILTRGKV